MKTLQEILQTLGINISLIIGGTIGGFIGMKKDVPVWLQITTVLSAAFIANYCTPVILEIFNMDKGVAPGLGFICGYSGKAMLDYTIDKLKKK